jgi:hypothetical protein
VEFSLIYLHSRLPNIRDCLMGTPNRNALPIAQSGSRLGNRSYCHVGGSRSPLRIAIPDFMPRMRRVFSTCRNRKCSMSPSKWYIMLNRPLAWAYTNLPESWVSALNTCLQPENLPAAPTHHFVEPAPTGSPNVRSHLGTFSMAPQPNLKVPLTSKVGWMC